MNKSRSSRLPRLQQVRKIIFPLFGVLAFSGALASPVQLIIDTDTLTDADDTGALAVAHALEDSGEAHILGVMLSGHDSNMLNSNTVSAVNWYYNHNNKYPGAKESRRIPIGSYWALINSHGRIFPWMKKDFRFDHEGGVNFHKAIYDHRFPSDRKKDFNRPKSSDLYRSILTRAPDHSVKIAVIGTNYNIVNFLSSRWPDNYLLFRRKVKEVVFSASAEKGCNVNMCSRGDSSLRAKKNSDFLINRLMPGNVKMTFIDLFDVNCKHSPNRCAGKGFRNTGSPMELAYNHSYDELRYGAGIFDQLAVLVAVRGLDFSPGHHFRVKEHGYFDSRLVSDKKMYWRTGGSKNQRVVLLDNGGSATYRSALAEVSNLMYRSPSNPGIFQFVSRLYKVGLGRNADGGGLNYWINSLSSRRLSGGQVARGFFFSREYINKHTSNSFFVYTLYKAMLGRNPDPGGFNNWVNKLNQGQSRASVLNGFIYSAEFRRLANRYHIRHV